MLTAENRSSPSEETDVAAIFRDTIALMGLVVEIDSNEITRSATNLMMAEEFLFD